MQSVIKNIRELVWPTLLGIILGASLLYGLHIWKNFELKISRKPSQTSQRYHFNKPPIIEFNGERFAILAINDHKNSKLRSIIIKNLIDQKISISKVGDTAFKRAKVVKITKDCITLEDAQRKILISLPESLPSGGILNRIM